MIRVFKDINHGTLYRLQADGSVKIETPSGATGTTKMFKVADLEWLVSQRHMKELPPEPPPRITNYMDPGYRRA